jgi:gp16 family phage-associated protein
MQSESPFEPISKESIRKARARLALAGETVEEWARRNGFAPSIVRKILEGKRKAIRGESLKASIALGLRPEPTFLGDQHPSSSFPAGHTVGKGSSVASGNRRPELQLGEPAR